MVKLEHRTAGCVEPVDSLEVGLARVTVHCGLIPGSSGGGLFAEQDGELTLVGIISTVTADLSANGVVPLSSLHELLRHPELYSYPLPSERSQNEHLRLVLDVNGGSSRRRLRRLRASNIRQAWIAVAIVALGPGSREVAGAAEAQQCGRP